MQVRSEEERQSGSSSGCAGRLRVHMPAWSSDLSCRTSLWPSLGRLLCARAMSIEHDAFFSFYRPQVAQRIKAGGEVLGVHISIGKHRRGRPGKAGVDYQGHTGRRVQRRGGRAVGDCSVAACPLGSFRLSAARLWSSVSWHYSLVGRLCHQVPGSVPVLSPLSCDLEFWPRFCVWHCALRSLPRGAHTGGSARGKRLQERAQEGRVSPASTSQQQQAGLALAATGRSGLTATRRLAQLVSAEQQRVAPARK